MEGGREEEGVEEWWVQVGGGDRGRGTEEVEGGDRV